MGAGAEPLPKGILEAGLPPHGGASRAGTSQATSCGASRPRKPTSAACEWAAAALSVSALPRRGRQEQRAEAGAVVAQSFFCLKRLSSGDGRDGRGNTQVRTASGVGDVATDSQGCFPRRQLSPR